ncbi:Fur family transcriptional regulator [Acanthopleuribacter pedis]|uniref:Transcriptional repressor n=1 Tax=Acanthopleuribacter pedis TaxID=442870 RepID=A0A8J7QSB0_9BACT|nr:Fur family transcriptional regulator [Acanthopleuribacter pedis]MBO1323365.1 transcriptional repressor [Acanthopleuribacter pedis]
MRITKNQARKLLQECALRVTAPRLAVVRVLAEARDPLSHTEMLDRLGDTDWDPATVYRNLIKLRDAGLAEVVSRVDGIDRYALAREENNHKHPHFVCVHCGRVACLPEEITVAAVAEGPWAASVAKAMVQLRGECPDCLQPAGQA